MDFGSPLSSPAGGRLLCRNLHASPKSDIVRDLLGSRTWRRIVPGGILVHLAIHFDVKTACLPLPEADGVQTTLCEELPFQRIGWEVIVTLHHDRVIVFGQHSSIPNCLHGGAPVVAILSSTWREHRTYSGHRSTDAAMRGILTAQPILDSRTTVWMTHPWAWHACRRLAKERRWL